MCSVTLAENSTYYIFVANYSDPAVFFDLQVSTQASSNTPLPNNGDNSDILSGRWVSECRSNGSLSTRLILNFDANSNQFSSVQDVYFDSGCQTLRASEPSSYSGTYSVGATLTTSSGTQGYAYDVAFANLGPVTLYGAIEISNGTLYFSSGYDFNESNRNTEIDYSIGYAKQ